MKRGIEILVRAPKGRGKSKAIDVMRQALIEHGYSIAVRDIDFMKGNMTAVVLDHDVTFLETRR